MNHQGRRLGILGGTFDPPHIGHVAAARAALAAFDLDAILFVTAGKPWMKDEYSPAEDRFAMTVHAVAGDKAFLASRLELDRRGPTYTVDTLRALRELDPAGNLFFIAGADAVAHLGKWWDVPGIAGLGEIIAVTRPGHDLDAEPPAGVEVWPTVHVLPIEPVDVSSTAIRQLVRAGEDVGGLVAPAVARHIARRGLYRRSAA